MSLHRLCGGVLLLMAPLAVSAAVISDVSNTPHNLSVSGPGPVTASTETQICVFCHTPHAAEAIPNAPLWNRALSPDAAAGTYTLYTSNSIEATLEQPDGSSKLCLSCHDGTVALGKVNVLDGQADVTVDLLGTDPDGSMPGGSGATTGDTRDLGTSLTNDHPISFTYDSGLASADGELYDPATAAHDIANRAPGYKPTVPLENDRVQCISCHDPHVRDSTGTPIKFLTLNRFQETAEPTQGLFNEVTDIICLACHDKAGWAFSAHANSQVADELYDAAAAGTRDFPTGLAVWEAGCLNCHDTHTVQGATRLLREGVDINATQAQEETCYQCHDGTTAVLTDVAGVPNIASDFAALRHMPITTAEQQTGGEIHDVGTGDDILQGTQRGKDLVEAPLNLGKGEPLNRHVECTDCHNPHRVIRNQAFNADPAFPDAEGTHNHDFGHTNIASGVLAGSWGVEPNYLDTTWGALPDSYTVKRGYAGVGASDAAAADYVTREYQICLKCHSDYAWDTPSFLGDSGGGTPSGTNNLTQFTNQAMEFQAPLADQGENPGAQGAAANHRSWHPVIAPTGRTTDVRGGNLGTGFIDDTLWLAPWNDNGVVGANVGSQTMYCSDCHGSDTGAQTVVPTGTNPWGPHGSANNFVLKGTWDNETGAAGANDTGICFKCHDWNEYGNPNNNNPLVSGFRVTTNNAQCAMNFDQTNLHIGHAARIGVNLECTWCHVAVPHGGRNKALLVDISDADGCGGAEPCTNGPYYLEAYLGGGGVVNWRASSEWTAADCGGVNWMNGGGGNSCANPQ